VIATELEDEKDPKRAWVVLSKGHQVAGLGYSRLIGSATKVIDRGEISSNPNWVNWVSKMEQHYPSRVSQGNSTDRQADRVSRVSQNSSKDQRADRVS
jgi:transketolase N-terminal domain/subunit